MAGLNIGIVGAGMGGLSAAIALRGMGHDARIFEQAERFARVGADINLTPNAVHALDRLDLGPALRASAAQPTHRISRMWDTGEETSRIEMRAAAQGKYGAPQVTIHRADLLQALEAKLPAACFGMGHTATGVIHDQDGVTVQFASGKSETFDLVIGDAIVLARSLEMASPADIPEALECYEGARKARTARVQIGSRGNKWLKEGGNADWLYGYDAWAAPLTGAKAPA